MKAHLLPKYSIKDIIAYRALDWPNSEDFLYLTEIPLTFEVDAVKSDYYCFGMIAQGQLEITINGNLYDLSPNSLMVYRPGQLWKVSNVAEGTVGSFILFSKKFIDSLNENIFSVKTHSFLSPGVPALIELSDPDSESIKNLFSEIFAIFHHLSKSSWELVARNLTSALIYEADEIVAKYIHADQVITNKEDELFSRFNHLLATHFNTSRKPEFYASLLCITPDHLYKTLKKISGQTPTDLINKKVISEASYLVSYTLTSFVEIARHLNFSDQFTFSKYFKRSTGYSPLHYRTHSNLLVAANGN